MRSKGFTEKLNERLQAIPPGTPFIASDFSDITDAKTIRRLLKVKIDAWQHLFIHSGKSFSLNTLIPSAYNTNPNTASTANWGQYVPPPVMSAGTKREFSDKYLKLSRLLLAFAMI